MPSIEERLAALESEIITLREQVTDTHTLAAHADRDVAEFRTELRAQTGLLNATRLDMVDLRSNTNENFAELRTDVTEIKAGISQIVSMLEGLTGEQS